MVNHSGQTRKENKMKELLNAITLVNRMNESIQQVFRVLNSTHKVTFNKDEGNYFLDIYTGEQSNTYVCYDYVENRITFSHTPDIRIECEDETYIYEATAETLNTIELLKVIRTVLR